MVSAVDISVAVLNMKLYNIMHQPQVCGAQESCDTPLKADRNVKTV